MARIIVRKGLLHGIATPMNKMIVALFFRIRGFLLLLRIGLVLFGFLLLLAVSRWLAVSRRRRDNLLFEWIDPGIAPGWAGILNVLLGVDLRISLFVFHVATFNTHCKCRARRREFALPNC